MGTRVSEIHQVAHGFLQTHEEGKVDHESTKVLDNSTTAQCNDIDISCEVPNTSNE